MASNANISPGTTPPRRTNGANNPWGPQSNEGHSQGWHTPTDRTEVIEGEVSSILNKRQTRRHQARLLLGAVAVLLLIALILVIVHETTHSRIHF